MLRRTAVASRPVFRRFNHRMEYIPNAAKAAEYKSTYEHTLEHAASATRLWKNLSLATVPVLVACAYYVYGTESHHLSHLWQLSEVPAEDWPPEYEFQNIRTRKFFWGNGNETLFWSWVNHDYKK